MKDYMKRLLAKFDELINNLEIVNAENIKFLNDASVNKNIPLEEMQERMKQAKDNINLLNYYKAQRDSLNDKYKKQKNTEE
jgi:hypothetical protein